jgi:hypothetical protein
MQQEKPHQDDRAVNIKRPHRNDTAYREFLNSIQLFSGSLSRCLL